MFKKILTGLLTVVLIGLAVLLVFETNPQALAQTGPNNSNRTGYGPWNPAGTQNSPGAVSGQNAALIAAPVSSAPDQAEVDAMLRALADEYHAWAIYNQVVADFGAVRPFVNIRRAEEQHILALTALLNKYGLTVPENEWESKVPSFESVSAACASAVQAEKDNAGLYDDLFAAVDNPDIQVVFTSLQSASLNRHLPAFERCAAR